MVGSRGCSRCSDAAARPHLTLSTKSYNMGSYVPSKEQSDVHDS